MPRKKKQSKPKASKPKKVKSMTSVAPLKKKNLDHYIDNSTLLDEMKKHRNAVQEYKANNSVGVKPRVPESVGKAILMIAERLSTKPNFAGYSYRDEMISDGIENCLTYLDNFDPAKSSNPFAYFTQIIFYAFIRRIQREKKQAYVKMQLFENMDTRGYFRNWADKQNPEDGSYNPYADFFKLSKNDLNYFDQQKAKKNKAKKKAKGSKNLTSLDKYMEDGSSEATST